MPDGAEGILGNLQYILGVDASGFRRGLAQAEAEVDTAGNRISRAFERIAAQGAGLATRFLIAITVGRALTGMLTGTIGATVAFEQAMAGVAKVTDASASELADMTEAVRQMAKEIPITHEELARIMMIAAQIGIRGTANLVRFTDVVARMGVTTSLSTEEAAFALARFMNIMQTAPANVERVASTIVGLGFDFAGTETEVANMALRIAGMGMVLGMTEADVLAFAAGMTDVGITAEVGGTAISRVFQRMSTAAQSGTAAFSVFARTAGMSVTEFADLVRTQPAQAVLAFFEGLEKVRESGGNVIPILKQLGIDARRETDVVLRLTTGVGSLSRALDEGSSYWEQNNALLRASDIYFNTTAGRAKVMANTARDLGIEIGDTLLPALNGLIRGLTDTASGAEGAMRFLKENEGAAVGLGVALSGLLLPVLLRMVITLGVTTVSAATSATRALLGYMLGVRLVTEAERQEAVAQAAATMTMARLGQQVDAATLSLAAQTLATRGATIGAASFGAALRAVPLINWISLAIAVGGAVYGLVQMLKGFGAASSGARSDLDRLNQALSEAERRVRATGASLETVRAAQLDAFDQELMRLVKTANLYIISNEDWEKQLHSLDRALAETVAGVDLNSTEIERLAQRYEAMSAAANASTVIGARQKEVYWAVAYALREQAKGLEADTAAAQRLLEQMDPLAAAVAQFADTVKQATEENKTLYDSIDDLVGLRTQEELALDAVSESLKGQIALLNMQLMAQGGTNEALKEEIRQREYQAEWVGYAKDAIEAAKKEMGLYTEASLGAGEAGTYFVDQLIGLITQAVNAGVTLDTTRSAVAALQQQMGIPLPPLKVIIDLTVFRQQIAAMQQAFGMIFPNMTRMFDLALSVIDKAIASAREEAIAGFKLPALPAPAPPDTSDVNKAAKEAEQLAQEAFQREMAVLLSRILVYAEPQWRDLGITLVDQLNGGLEDAFPEAAAIVRDLAEKIASDAVTAADFEAAGTQIIDLLRQGIAGAKPEVTREMYDLAQDLLGIMETTGQQLGALLAKILTGQVEPLRGLGDKLVQFMESDVFGKLPDTVQALVRETVRKLAAGEIGAIGLMNLGQRLLQMMKQGVIAGTPDVVRAVEELARELIDAIVKAMQQRPAAPGMPLPEGVEPFPLQRGLYRARRPFVGLIEPEEMVLPSRVASAVRAAISRPAQNVVNIELNVTNAGGGYKQLKREVLDVVERSLDEAAADSGIRSPLTALGVGIPRI
jgi:TP901 family phage tail tape measure protein